jgi:hypothetical protein
MDRMIGPGIRIYDILGKILKVKKKNKECK